MSDDPLRIEIDKARAEEEKALAEKAQHQAEAERCERNAQIARTRREALEFAAQLRQKPTPTSPRGGGSANKGRQPGAISGEWRKTLLAMAAKYPTGATEDEIAELARLAGLPNVRPKDVRDRMIKYETHRYVEAHPNGWQVTEHAIKRFGGASPSSSAAQEPEIHTATPVLEAAV